MLIRCFLFWRADAQSSSTWSRRCFPSVVQSIPPGEPTAGSPLVPTPGASSESGLQEHLEHEEKGPAPPGSAHGSLHFGNKRPKGQDQHRSREVRFPIHLHPCKSANGYREPNLVPAFKATPSERDKCVSRHPKIRC